MPATRMWCTASQMTHRSACRRSAPPEPAAEESLASMCRELVLAPSLGRAQSGPQTRPGAATTTSSWAHQARITAPSTRAPPTSCPLPAVMDRACKKTPSTRPAAPMPRRSQPTPRPPLRGLAHTVYPSAIHASFRKRGLPPRCSPISISPWDVKPQLMPIRCTNR